MLISLSSRYGGFACCLASAIHDVAGRQGGTQFFDWVTCSIKSINEVLIENKSIDFRHDHLHLETACVVPFLDFEWLHSVHDFSFDNFLDSETRRTVTEKYHRRKERFLQTVAQENNDILLFFRYVKSENDLELNDLLRFEAFIKNVRNGRPFQIILVTHDSKVRVHPPNDVNIVIEYCQSPSPEFSEYDKIRGMYKTIILSALRKKGLPDHSSTAIPDDDPRDRL
jgi:hypothetical protein